MVHYCQRLALRLEPRDDVRSVHTDLEHLERDGPPDRRSLHGAPDLSHPAFADALEEAIRPDRHARFVTGVARAGLFVRWRWRRSRRISHSVISDAVMGGGN